MANTSTKQRLKFTDEKGDTQIVGVINGPGDEKGLSRAQLFHRAQQYDKLTCYGDASLTENIPNDNTEIQGDPFIIWEIYDPDTASWSENWRGYNPDAGRINRDTETKFKLWSTIRFYGKQEITLDPEQNSNLNDTDNVGVMEEIVSNISNVVLDTPTETEVQNNSDQDGYFTIKRYAMKNQERGRVLHEMTKVLGWALKPTGNKDGSGNWIWRYEPVGYGGTVDTIQDESAFQFSASESRGKIRNWVFEDKKNVINIVEIKNTSKSVTKSITGVDTSNDIFTVSGDLTGVVESGTELLVTNSTGNDGLYNVSSVSYDSGNTETDITVQENVSNSTADGSISVSAETVLGRYSAGSEPSPNSVDKYGERYQSHQVNFMETDGDADRLAKRIVDKNKDADEGGNLKASPRYDGNEANNSFAIGSRKRNIFTDQDVVAVDTTNNEFTVSGNVTGNLSIDDLFDIQGSTGNDGTYTVASLSYDSTNDETTIGVDESVTDATADGEARIYAKVFTVTEQINHYPENSTDFTVTFEREVEKKAVMAENVRSEREKLYPSSSEGVVGQTGLTAPDVLGESGNTAPDVVGETGDTAPDVLGESGNTAPDVAGETGDTSPNVDGNSDAEESDNIDSDEFFDSSFSISNGWNQVGPLADITEEALVHEITIELSDLPDGSTYDFEIVVVREGSEVVFHDKVENLNNSQVSDIVGVATDEHYQKTFRLRPGGWATANPESDSYELQLKTQGGATPTLTVFFETAALTHNHASGTYDAVFHPHDDGTLDGENHPHDDGTYDGEDHPHDDGTLDGENHPHDDGTYDGEDHPHQGGELKGKTSEEDNKAR